MKIDLNEPSSLRVTIMGLGLHGGGLASALFFLRRGARVTVTDLRSEDVLKSSLEPLKGFSLRAVLGRHEERDFAEADLIIKNPAVPEDSPFLGLARSRGVAVETDLSIFLRLCSNPILAVTGSKGKSTTAAAIHHCLQAESAGPHLGGNITVSPLTFIHQLQEGEPVVLELSSWQLSDLSGKGLLKPRISLLTNILPDHQNRYPSMERYLADKKVIFQAQEAADFAILNQDDPWQRSLPAEIGASVRYFSSQPLPEGVPGAFLQGRQGLIRLEGESRVILRQNLRLPGIHNRLNLLAAGLAVSLLGYSPPRVARALQAFSGLEHRLEYCGQKGGIRFYNDSAATIPQATVAALESLPPPCILIAGGTDKKIDFAPLLPAVRRVRSLLLLPGSATQKMLELFDREGLPYLGPFGSLQEAVRQAYGLATPGSTILFSPGCTSFEMFHNEFDRGQRFKQIVASLKD